MSTVQYYRFQQRARWIPHGWSLVWPWFGPTVPEATTSQREGAVWPHNAMGRNSWLNSCKVWCQPNKLAGLTANGPAPTPAATSCSGGATIQTRSSAPRPVDRRPQAQAFGDFSSGDLVLPGPAWVTQVALATRPRAGGYGQPAPTWRSLVSRARFSPHIPCEGSG